MNYYEVAPSKIIRSNSSVLTYSSDLDIRIGQIVSIEVGKKEVVGIVFRKVSKPKFGTKTVTKIVESQPLPMPLIELSKWISEYYNTHLALVLQSFIPNKLHVNRRPKDIHRPVVKRERTNILFNREQSSAIESITKAKPGTFLIQGVTGSGKTEIYIELTRRSLAGGNSAMILIPEIALTSQIVAEFSLHFKNIYVIHSSIGEAEKHIIWREILSSSSPVVVIGARSALFSPIAKLGLIIVDEAHEPSYKQNQSPKYSALRVATMLGRYHEAKVIFGSATPNIIDRYLADQQATPVIKLTKRAKSDTIAPSISLIDMTKRENFTRHRFISDNLLSSIEHSLGKKEQSLIFHNRRGSASLTLCENCGYSAACPNCMIPLTLHSDHHKLMCHICSHSESVPSSCPVCKHAGIIFKGFGTKLIESELKKLFPKARISRFDADNLTGETLEANYDALYSGDIDIAIGTQVVAKGLDLPHLRTVGVIQADSGLALPDYVSAERTFQLLAQVVGRVGRNKHKTSVIVQTYQPSHPVINFGLQQDYESFYSTALAERKKSLFPPFTHLLKLTCSYSTESGAIKSSKALALTIDSKFRGKVSILGPTPAFYERGRGTYRWQLIIKSPRREYLLAIINHLPKNNWQYDIDPTSLL